MRVKDLLNQIAGADPESEILIWIGPWDAELGITTISQVECHAGVAPDPKGPYPDAGEEPYVNIYLDATEATRLDPNYVE